ncbi:glycosyltransferase family 9 protein [Aerophototrophica crusticola]|uniref:Glycosyltransferase family 9 protein n=1 Tax=Aerophototrophica crusticola TaxID=1709002 RepID=A0A858R520_9PROT|nr:glycosyltransferase family 9 protein [Rhodospirillaceae bacterium B3]
MADGGFGTGPQAEALLRAGTRALEARRVARAAALFRRAERLGADPLAEVEARWKAAMLLGRYEWAWRLSDSVLASRAPEDFNRPWTPYHTRCVWDGTPLAGRRVLVRCYHGLGDSVQFLRYAPALEAQGCRVAVEIQPELLSLARDCPGVAEAVALGEADDLLVEERGWEVQVESMELSHALRTLPHTIPNDVPYLGRGLPRRVRPAGEAMRVGLVWQAGGWDARRSLPLAALEPLLGLSGVELVSLQQGPAREELAAFPAVRDGAVDRLEALAEAMCSLDLMVAVDTMAAHLAGALAVPTVALLHQDADWRWGAAGTRTPWYPTLHLARQRVQGDWTPAVAEAVEIVRARLGG